MALTIMVIAFASILTVQSASVQGSIKARQMNTVTMLAKTKMIETEQLIEGKKFIEVKKDDGGVFKEPYQDYSWKMEIKEVEFPTVGGGGTAPAEGEGEADNSQSTETLMKLVSKYLSDAVREVKITVTWKVKKGDRNYTVTTYWVDLNHEFSLSP